MGPYNDEARRYEKVPGYDEGHWYIKNGTSLYIVPNAEAEIEGQDDETLEALNAIYREKGTFEKVDPIDTAEQLGLDLVASNFKHFDAEIGYYTA